MKILWILMLLVCLAAGVIICDVNRFVVRKYIVTGRNLKKDYHFVMLSDLHGKSFGRQNQKLLQKIQEINPEGILIAGDMITAKPDRDFTETVNFIRELAKRYPVYYGSGNHEYRMAIYPEKYKDMSERFEREISHPNLIRLHNNHIILEEENILIGGVEIDREFYKKIHAPKMDSDYLTKTLGKLQKEYYSILIAHNPTYFPAYADYGADLVLSGHVHGGIARLPFLGGVISPSLRLFPKYDGGIFYEKNSTMILGRGLGSHTLPIRFLNPGELIEVTIQMEK